MVSVNRLLRRRSPFYVQRWILDSGAYTRLSSGKGHLPIVVYANEVMRWHGNNLYFLLIALVRDPLPRPLLFQILERSRYGWLEVAVCQDWPCDYFSWINSGKHPEELQYDTFYSYLVLRKILPPLVNLMPVLQGQRPRDYVEHLQLYGDHLLPGMWVGVGSLCQYSDRPAKVEEILLAIHSARPDLQLHGFAVKEKVLRSGIVRDLLASVDSQAHGLTLIPLTLRV